LDVGFLTGSAILGVKVNENTKAKHIQQLNDGTLDGIIMTDKVGATGLNLTGANHIIFLGSLYSIDYEKQAIGMSADVDSLIIGRIARKGQRRIPKAYIIASRSFTGDKAALDLKQSRGEQDTQMMKALSEQEAEELMGRKDPVEIIDLTGPGAEEPMGGKGPVVMIDLTTQRAEEPMGTKDIIDLTI
jgi:Helicase conserved C-terminal domain